MIIAAAGGVARLPRMTASMALLLVIGVPVDTTCFEGMGGLLIIALMHAVWQFLTQLSCLTLIFHRQDVGGNRRDK